MGFCLSSSVTQDVSSMCPILSLLYSTSHRSHTFHSAQLTMLTPGTFRIAKCFTVSAVTHLIAVSLRYFVAIFTSTSIPSYASAGTVVADLSLQPSHYGILYIVTRVGALA